MATRYAWDDDVRHHLSQIMPGPQADDLVAALKREAEAEIRQRIAREVYAERITETPKGWSERYVAGWNDAVDAAADKIRDGKP